MQRTQSRSDFEATLTLEVEAAFIEAPGAFPRLGRLLLPPRTSGTSLVDVVAIPSNPLDLALASRTSHSARHESSYVPGSECVGRVLESDVQPTGSWVYAHAMRHRHLPAPSPSRSWSLTKNSRPCPTGSTRSWPPQWGIPSRLPSYSWLGKRTSSRERLSSYRAPAGQSGRSPS